MVELPTPDILASLHLEQGESLHLASCDISQYYNRLQAPAFPVPFLGLSRIRRSKLGFESGPEVFVPCLRCIPMGATFAGHLAQGASIAIVRRSGLLGSLIGGSGRQIVPRQVGTIVVYIDDITVVSTSACTANDSTSRNVSTLSGHKLPDAPDKRQMAPSGKPGEALGLWRWPEGVLTIKPKTVLRLRVRTERLLRLGFASATDLRQTFGLCICICLLRRELLSILDKAFEFMQTDDEERRRRLPPAVGTELNMLLDLFPLMYADLRAGFCIRVYASDAS